MCIEKSTKIKGVKDRGLFFAKNAPKPGSFLAKNGKKSGSKLEKMAQKKSDWQKWWRKKNKS